MVREAGDGAQLLASGDVKRLGKAGYRTRLALDSR